MRNASVHFTVPENQDWHCTALKFLFEIMEPLVYGFWQDTIVHHAGTWDDYLYEPDGLRSQLEQCGINILPHVDKLLLKEDPKPDQPPGA